MTSKNWYFNLAKEDLKRRIWLLALTGLILFFSFPVLTILYAGAIDGYESYQIGMEQFQNRMESLVSIKNGWMLFLVAACAVIYGSSGFSYLNSKSKVDFYHSLPVRREKLFLVQYLNGFLMLAISYLVFLILTIGLATVSGADFRILMEKAVTSYLVNMSFFLLLYATVVTAMMMTGNQIVALLGTAVFFFYIPIAGVLLEGFCSLWLLTYWADGRLIRLTNRFSPFILFLEGVASETPLKYGIIAAVAGLAISLFAFWLYKKRPSEGAGKSMVFPVSQPIIRIAIVLCSGMSGAAFGWGLRGTMGWSLFFLVCGCVISHGVIEAIYHADFKKLFSHPAQMAGCVAAALLIVLGFRYDLTGYDRYVPGANDLKSISIDIQDLDSWVDYGYVTKESGYSLDWKWVNRTGHLFENMKLTETEAVIEIASAGSERAREARELASRNNYNFRYGYTDFAEHDINVTVLVQFEKLSGRKTIRRYTIPMSQIEDKLSELYEQESFKIAMYPVLLQEEDLAYVYYEKYNSGANLWQDDAPKAEEFRKAYGQDLMEQTTGMRKQENPIARVRFVTAKEDMLIKLENLKWDSWERQRMIQWNHYPVYPSFKRTIALLEEAGVLPEEMPRDLTITGGELGWYEDTSTMSLYHTARLTPEEIEEMLPYMIYGNDSNWNLFMPVDNNITVSGGMTNADSNSLSKEGGEARADWQFYFPKDRIPDSIKKKMEKSL